MSFSANPKFEFLGIYFSCLQVCFSVYPFMNELVSYLNWYMLDINKLVKIDWIYIKSKLR